MERRGMGLEEGHFREVQIVSRALSWMFCLRHFDDFRGRIVTPHRLPRAMAAPAQRAPGHLSLFVGGADRLSSPEIVQHLEQFGTVDVPGIMYKAKTSGSFAFIEMAGVSSQDRVLGKIRLRDGRTVEVKLATTPRSPQRSAGKGKGKGGSPPWFKEPRWTATNNQGYR